MVLGIMGNFVYVLPLSLLLVFAVEAALGRTGGKLLLGLRVGGEGKTPVIPRQLWGRTALKTSGFSLMVLALLLGSWPLAAAALAAGLVFFLGFFAALAPSRQALHDRLTRTAVFRYRAS
jgi:uncharacterized RDD family membrane protein YckC